MSNSPITQLQNITLRSSTYNRPRRPRGGVEVQHYSFFNFGARWWWVVNATPGPLYPQERPGTHCMGGWVEQGPVWMGVGNSIPGPVQPVANRYTDYAIPAHSYLE